MHLDNFVEIISGKLCNKPCVSFINNITTKIDNIKNGDVFIARNADCIQNAINLGAYAIVSDSYIEILDNEIAWILVEDIDVALLKFIKYIKLINNIEIYSCDEITFKLATNLIKDKQISFASNIDELLESLFYKIIIINFDIFLFEIMYIQNKEELYFKIVKQTLFEMKIEYENETHQVIIPSIFTSNFNNMIYFCKHKHITFSLNLNENLFLPIFINSYSRISQYGQSMRFIYASKDKKIIDKYIDFVLYAKWGKALFLTTKSKNKKILTKKYTSKLELKKYFSINEFHFFIVFGIENDELMEILEKEQLQSDLF